MWNSSSLARGQNYTLCIGRQSLFFWYFFLTFNFILQYSWLTMLVDSKGTQPYIWYPFSPKFPCHLDCHITSSRVPGALQQVLVSYPFQIQLCVHVDPRLPNYTYTTRKSLCSLSVYQKLTSPWRPTSNLFPPQKPSLIHHSWARSTLT